MEEDKVKKSVDIAESDEKWLKNRPVNFSKFVRNKIAEERLESLDSTVRDSLKRQLIGIEQKGQVLKEKWGERREELKEEYSCEMVDRQHEYLIFSYNDKEFTAHWHPDDPLQGTPREEKEKMPEQAKEFINEYVGCWFDLLEEHGDYIEEETDFEWIAGDEATETFEGKNILRDFKIYTKHLPTNAGEIIVRYLNRITLEAGEFLAF